ncbi:DnaD domain-containing protein [Abyssicoccus albus]|uniref:DNA replication protein DnaD n=1 Tax=Abyssicoccus albus TaxID=1817405 RepID=A0A3N5BN56_9BACL|nr:DnaD domain protein [Abyssicoccus albus]RPF58009.1 DNA replication protein DnaD [Abyssicoccus albus]
MESYDPIKTKVGQLEHTIERIIEGNHFDIKSFLITQNKLTNLNAEEMIVLLYIIEMNSANHLVSLPDITEALPLNMNMAATALKKLTEQNYIHSSTQKGNDGIYREVISTQPLHEKIISLLKGPSEITHPIEGTESNHLNQTQKDNEPVKSDLQLKFERLLKKFEAEFGRTFSPIEIQSIRQWIDEYHESLIEQALVEAVLNHKLNIKYISKILSNWKEQNITNISEAKEYTNKYYRSNNTQFKKTVQSYPVFNWLEDK